MIGMHSIPTPSQKYCVRQIEGELIFLSEGGDSIHAIDEIGSFFWDAIDGRKTLEEILSVLVEEFEAEEDVLRADLLEFVTELAEKGLLTITNDPGTA
jgi:hypothetical protein